MAGPDGDCGYWGNAQRQLHRRHQHHGSTLNHQPLRDRTNGGRANSVAGRDGADDAWPRATERVRTMGQDRRRRHGGTIHTKTTRARQWVAEQEGTT